MVSLTNLTEIGHTNQHTIAHVTSLYGVKDDFEIQAAVLWGDTLRTLPLHSLIGLCPGKRTLRP